MTKIKNSLYRGVSSNGRAARKVLEENNIEFTQVFSNDDHQTPILFSEHGIYPYKGLKEITQYAKRNNPKTDIVHQ